MKKTKKIAQAWCWKSILAQIVIILGICLLMPKQTVLGEELDERFEIVGGKLMRYFNDEESTEVTIPSGVTSIGDFVFCGYTNLISITIPSSVTSIGDYAFYGCLNLESITIPKNVTDIGNYAFAYCVSLKKVKIGKNVVSIGNHAFDYCNSLSSITMPESIKRIGEYAFNECLSLKKIALNKGLEYIGNYAFKNCTSLNSISIPGSVKSVGTYVFDGCKHLSTVVISEGITRIGFRMFWNCSQLEDITMPTSVTDVGSEAFEGTLWLEEKRKENPLVIINGILIDGKTCTGKVTIPKKVKSIGASAFYKNNEVSEIILPSGVKEIGSWAFDRCRNLVSVILPEGLLDIGSGAFYGCGELGKVFVPNSVRRIGEAAFAYCDQLVISDENTSYANNQVAETKGVEISDSRIVIAKGEKYQLSINGSYNNVTWKANRKSIAKVNEKGVVIGVAEGYTTVIATVDGEKYKCKVYVEGPFITMPLLAPGEEGAIGLGGKDFNNISFSSSNPSVVTVDEKGILTAKRDGWSLITIKIGKDKYENWIIIGNNISSAVRTGNTEGLSKEDIEVVNEMRRVLEMLITEDMSDVDKAFAVYDYVRRSTFYDNTFHLQSYSYRRPLLEHLAVCSGYSHLVEFFLNALMIENRFATNTEMNHAWNLVCFDGDWYCVDATWGRFCEDDGREADGQHPKIYGDKYSNYVSAKIAADYKQRGRVIDSSIDLEAEIRRLLELEENALEVFYYPQDSTSFWDTVYKLCDAYPKKKISQLLIANWSTIAVRTREWTTKLGYNEYIIRIETIHE